MPQGGKPIWHSTGVEVSDALQGATMGVSTADGAAQPWYLLVRGPHGTSATFRTLKGYKSAAAATTWHRVRDAYCAEIHQPDRPGDPPAQVGGSGNANTGLASIERGPAPDECWGPGWRDGLGGDR